MRILALSGSLRRRSSNTALLRAAAALAPAGMEIELYEGLGALPHFNPDVEESGELPPAAADLRARVGAADGLLISSPEYARGVPGSLKNALDWLVGGPEFVGKPVALANASPRSTHAQASLALTLATLSGRLVEEASVTLPLLGGAHDEAAIAADPAMAAALRAALAAFAAALERRRPDEPPGPAFGA